MDNATPDGLVAEESVELTEDQVLEQAFDDAQNEETPPDDEAPDSSPETETVADEAAEEPAVAEVVEAPSGLPKALRDEWGNLPESARAAVEGEHREWHRRMSELGRQAQGLGPIRDELASMVKDYPQLADMKPREVLSQLRELADVSRNFTQDPVGTLMGYIDKHGLKEAMSQALAGQEVSQGAQETAALKQEIEGLKRQLSRATDPRWLQSQVHQITSVESVNRDVQQFAAQAEHWADVEQYIPTMIPVAQAKLGPSTAPGAVLQAAYEMAIEQFKPELQAPDPKVAAQDAAPEPDPVVAEKALKAKSVNVKGGGEQKPRPQSLDELLSNTYDAAQKR